MHPRPVGRLLISFKKTQKMPGLADRRMPLTRHQIGSGTLGWNLRTIPGSNNWPIRLRMSATVVSAGHSHQPRLTDLESALASGQIIGDTPRWRRLMA